MQHNLYYQDEYVKDTFNGKMLLRLIKRAFSHKNWFVGSLIIEFIASAFSLLPSILYSVIVSRVFPSDGVLPADYALMAGLALGGLAVVYLTLTVTYFLESYIPERFAYLLCSELRSELFGHVTHLSFRYFDTHATGKILVRATNYIDELSQLFGQLFYMLLYFACVIVVGLAWIFALDWRLALAVVAALVPLTAVMYFMSRAIHNRAGRDRNKNSNYTAFVTENISGAEVVRAYNRGALNEQIADGLFDEYSRAFMRTTRVREAFFPLSNGFINAVTVLLVYGVALALSLTGGGMDLGTVVAVGLVLSEITGGLGNICQQISNVFALTTNVERVYDTIDTPIEIADRENAVPLADCRGEVRFDHVNFSYVESVPVLKDFTLEAAAGETVALVGATGSGKTTIVNLLSRFYDVQSGAVTVDGRDVREYALQTLRTGVGAMMQDTFLFHGTVLENIRFARPDASDEACIAAARAAHADAFIRRLPEGYATEIDEGNALSGGERQLLSFARLILADPRIIVLDEATSHVDTQTEREVQESLKALLKGRTSFVIAHRLSTIRGADKIVFIRDGEIAEQGTHEELIALNGAYAQMIRAAAV
ncbi:MAG TPA: ABC transporter ATP-binding protein/permease [Firmicutes bacterium]|nr:ABC transporter ATP-binding protein/permease [Bacillota bacterium]